MPFPAMGRALLLKKLTDSVKSTIGLISYVSKFESGRMTKTIAHA